MPPGKRARREDVGGGAGALDPGDAERGRTSGVAPGERDHRLRPWLGRGLARLTRVVHRVHGDPVPARRRGGQDARLGEAVAPLAVGLAARGGVGEPQVVAGLLVPAREQRAARGLKQYPAHRFVACPVSVGRRAGPVEVGADRERGPRRVPRQPPLAAGGLAERAAEPAELRRQRDVQVAGLGEPGHVPGQPAVAPEAGQQVIGEQVTRPDRCHRTCPFSVDRAATRTSRRRA